MDSSPRRTIFTRVLVGNERMWVARQHASLGILGAKRFNLVVKSRRLSPSIQSVAVRLTMDCWIVGRWIDGSLHHHHLHRQHDEASSVRRFIHLTHDVFLPYPFVFYGLGSIYFFFFRRYFCVFGDCSFCFAWRSLILPSVRLMDNCSRLSQTSFIASCLILIPLPWARILISIQSKHIQFYCFYALCQFAISSSCEDKIVRV